jgi:hypothetical protein
MKYYVRSEACKKGNRNIRRRLVKVAENHETDKKETLAVLFGMLSGKFYEAF